MAHCSTALFVWGNVTWFSQPEAGDKMARRRGVNVVVGTTFWLLELESISNSMFLGRNKLSKTWKSINLLTEMSLSAILIIFPSKMPKNMWLQLFKWEHLLLFFVSYDHIFKVALLSFINQLCSDVSHLLIGCYINQIMITMNLYVEAAHLYLSPEGEWPA